VWSGPTAWVGGSEQVGDVVLKTEVVLPRLLAKNFIQLRRHQLSTTFTHTQCTIVFTRRNLRPELLVVINFFQGSKTRFFLKKAQPSGVFLGFIGFFGQAGKK